MTRVAVVGAGLSGLVAARELRECCEVVVFEKSRGFGGRMATRYEEDFEFDHGAQFFTAHSEEFRAYLQKLIDDGVIATWNVRFAELDRQEVATIRQWGDAYPHYVGMPRMNSIGKYLADGLDVRRRTNIARLTNESGAWRLSDCTGTDQGRFDWVLFAMPAAQTASLAPARSQLRNSALEARMKACYSLMLGFEAPLALPWQAALVRGADISWISVNSSKPGRAQCFALVVHSTNSFADANIDRDPSKVCKHLVDEASMVIGIDCGNAAIAGLQRWRFANADTRDGPLCLLETDRRLAGCGDWFRRGRVESAFLSGLEVGRKLRTLVE